MSMNKMCSKNLDSCNYRAEIINTDNEEYMCIPCADELFMKKELTEWRRVGEKKIYKDQSPSGYILKD